MTEIIWTTDPKLNINGTYFLSTIRTTFSKLVETFGPPTCGPNDFSGDKVTCEWRIEFALGNCGDETLTVITATIYDWKTGETPIDVMYDWHIGGKRTDSLDDAVSLVEYFVDRNH
ncbi:MAG: hypothetical protein EBR94_11635 [Bacteroidetes bacterium]|jgi:hypothetical protein|nr:hypothetical protein [Bacteroidota bacterium]NBV83110.1 hypothetical protein [bacterium]